MVPLPGSGGDYFIKSLLALRNASPSRYCNDRKRLNIAIAVRTCCAKCWVLVFIWLRKSINSKIVLKCLYKNATKDYYPNMPINISSGRFITFCLVIYCYLCSVVDQIKYSTQYSLKLPEVLLSGSSKSHFTCFCYKVFYFSNFKDFNTIAPAC